MIVKNEMSQMEEAIRNSSMSKEMGDELVKLGQKRATKILSKNKREIKRLEELGKAALLCGNKESYKYAVGKVRKIIQKPVDDEILEVLWKTSYEQVKEIIQAGIEAEKLKG